MAIMATPKTIDETLPDTRTLQNQAKSYAYYSRNQERILASLAEKYQETKKLYVTLKALQMHRVTKMRLVRSANSSNESTMPQPLPKKCVKDPLACWQESVTVHLNSGNLPFWLCRSSTLEGWLATLLNRQIMAERNTGMWDLNDAQLYDCPKAQYVECVYWEFHFLFGQDRTYNDNNDSIFKPCVDEMEVLSTHTMHCADTILNIDGCSVNYLKADALAAEVTTVGGWITELEIEVMNDPQEYYFREGAKTLTVLRVRASLNWVTAACSLGPFVNRELETLKVNGKTLDVVTELWNLHSMNNTYGQALGDSIVEVGLVRRWIVDSAANLTVKCRRWTESGLASATNSPEETVV
ncbi:hypothetical protein EDD85DRAFT_782996 [Armillaria nabsnona]|nr:hypothetical protein EDD85DRAFT_782996 [Armillaria nabsnona]